MSSRYIERFKDGIAAVYETVKNMGPPKYVSHDEALALKVLSR